MAEDPYLLFQLISDQKIWNWLGPWQIKLHLPKQGGPIPFFLSIFHWSTYVYSQIQYESHWSVKIYWF